MAGRIGPALAVSVATEADRDFAGARRLIVTRSPASVPKTGQGPWFGFTAWFGGGDEVAPYIRRCRFEVLPQPRASDHQHLSNALLPRPWRPRNRSGDRWTRAHHRGMQSRDSVPASDRCALLRRCRRYV